jgi:hypothetical protein
VFDSVEKNNKNLEINVEGMIGLCELLFYTSKSLIAQFTQTLTA